MEHLGTRLRTIGLDKIPSLNEMSPALDESGAGAGERAQVWTELWALHRENKDVAGGSDGSGGGSGAAAMPKAAPDLTPSGRQF